MKSPRESGGTDDERRPVPNRALHSNPEFSQQPDPRMWPVAIHKDAPRPYTYIPLVRDGRQQCQGIALRLGSEEEEEENARYELTSILTI